jgi:hypothetical protein
MAKVLLVLLYLFVVITAMVFLNYLGSRDDG